VTASFAGQQNTQSQKEVEQRSSGPYCGLYCLYSVINLTGRHVAFKTLLRPEYVGSQKGSSLTELKKAAADYGLYAKILSNLTSQELRASSDPIILHVKSESTSTQYNHYELFLGTENGQARLFNPPEPIRLVGFHQLAPRWGGTGLIVSAELIRLGTLFAPARKRLVSYGAIAVAIIWIVRWARHRWPLEIGTASRRRLLGLSAAQSAGFVIAAVLGGMVYHFANDEGFLANATGTASVQQAYVGSFIPKISERKVSRHLNSGTVFIDARYARDFEAGHLEGALSVPVDANDVKRETAMAQVAKDARIVVYCQSAGCKFAEKVAIEFMRDGFSNVSIFKGGWREWAAKSDK
jgi:rhodanese-related sulfurtransferase